MKRILLIGKRGFLGNYLNKYLRKKFKISFISFSEINSFKKSIVKYDYIINTSINKNYIKKKYDKKFDNDFQISNFLDPKKNTFIFLSSRKVYKPRNNIKETSLLEPKSFYSINKLVTEKRLSKLLDKKVLILRVSNLIGKINLNTKYRKIHNTFIDNFFINIKNNKMFDNKNIYKDFISTRKFSEIIRKLLNINAHGVFNISIGEKIFLKDLVNWLNRYNKTKNIDLVKIPNNFNKDCFYLNNSKLKNKIKINISKLELKNFCIDLSKHFFK